MNDLNRRLNPVIVPAGFLALAAVLVVLDLQFSQAGLWALMIVSVTVGMGHGALDVQLLLRRFSPPSRAIALGVAYLLVVVLLGWALSQAVSAALWLLLGMSIWHFGEDYARWDQLPSRTHLLTRLVVGGAPVMFPIWLSPVQMAVVVETVLQGGDARPWHLFAAIWLALLVVWVLLCGVLRYRDARIAWYELAGAALLNLVFSPLMAFALYFGVYHAPVHIWRVWRGRPANLPVLRFNLMGVGTSFSITVLLGALLWVQLDLSGLMFEDSTVGLRWLIVALAALTFPHLVLVSLCTKMLSGSDPR